MDPRPATTRSDEELELDRWYGQRVTSWRERWGAPQLHVFRRVGSTNDVARRLAAAGAPAGTLVLADEQTRGRGQRGRVWRSPAGASLALSMVLRPERPLQGPVLTLRLGIAAARALDPVMRRRVHLEWPNDLVLGAADGETQEPRWGKVGGILCEAVAGGDRIEYVVAGIGLNLRRPDGGWGDDVDARAASLADAAVDRHAGDPERASSSAMAADVAGRVARAWLDVARSGQDTLDPQERAEFERRDALRGRAITLEGRHAGVAVGISDTGALRVDTGSGVTDVRAGTVRPIEPVQEERP